MLQLRCDTLSTGVVVTSPIQTTRSDKINPQSVKPGKYGTASVTRACSRRGRKRMSKLTSVLGRLMRLSMEKQTYTLGAYPPTGNQCFIWKACLKCTFAPLMPQLYGPKRSQYRCPHGNRGYIYTKCLLQNCSDWWTTQGRYTQVWLSAPDIRSTMWRVAD